MNLRVFKTCLQILKLCIETLKRQFNWATAWPKPKVPRKAALWFQPVIMRTSSNAICTYIYIYMYIYIEREREKLYLQHIMYVCIYIYVHYIYTYICIYILYIYIYIYIHTYLDIMHTGAPQGRPGHHPVGPADHQQGGPDRIPFWDYPLKLKLYGQFS